VFVILGKKGALCKNCRALTFTVSPSIGVGSDCLLRASFRGVGTDLPKTNPLQTGDWSIQQVRGLFHS